VRQLKNTHSKILPRLLQSGCQISYHCKILEGQLAAPDSLLCLSEEIRTIIYTTNAIESLNNSLKKTIKNRASFPTDEAALKLLYLSLKNIMKKWTMPVRNWGWR